MCSISPAASGAALWAFLAMSAPGLAADAVAIRGVEARLFYNHTAILSADVLANPQLLPPNLPITDNPSSDTLLVVRLTGPAGRYVPDQSVQVSARWRRPAASRDANPASETAVLDASEPVGGFGPDGRTSLGFWLNGTGCVPVAVSVSLRSARAASGAASLVTIPFHCGE